MRQETDKKVIHLSKLRFCALFLFFLMREAAVKMYGQAVVVLYVLQVYQLCSLGNASN